MYNEYFIKTYIKTDKNPHDLFAFKILDNKEMKNYVTVHKKKRKNCEGCKIYSNHINCYHKKEKKKVKHQKLCLCIYRERKHIIRQLIDFISFILELENIPLLLHYIKHNMTESLVSWIQQMELII